MSDLTQKLGELQAANSDTAAHKRLSALFDNGSYTELDKFALKENFGGVVTAMGLVEGSTVYAFAQNTEDNLGAMSKLQWQKISKIYSLAAKTGAPVIAIYDSMGANLKEPAQTMAAYRLFVKAQGEISGVVPQISVIAGNCGGTAAIAATTADIVIMSEGAKLFLTPPSNTCEENGTACSCAENASAHIVCEDDILAVAKARELITMLPQNNLCPAPLFNYTDGDINALTENCGKDTAAFAAALSDEYSAVELYKGFGKGSYTALATVGGSAAGIIATTGEYISKCDASKLASFISFCDAFNIPIVAVIDSLGFKKSAHSEAKGELRSAAKLAAVFSSATTVKIAVVAGYAVAGAYMTLCNSDLIIATPNAVISPLEPETAVAFMHEDKITAETSREDAVKAYEEEEASVFTAAEAGLVDMVVEAGEVKKAVVDAISALRGKRVCAPAKKHINVPM